MMWGYSYTWPMMLEMVFWNLLWLALLGLAVWVLARWLLRSTAHERSQALLPPTEPSALETLRRRYARGEIDAITFEQMCERLQATYEPISRS